MPCSECDRLMAMHYELNRKWTTAVKARIECAADTSAADYTELRTGADEAWLDSESARLEVDQHKQRH
jgi:hypothetical protein